MNSRRIFGWRYSMRQMGRPCLFAIVAFLLLANSPPTDFGQVINDPREVDGKRVSLVGIAQIEGNRFALYQDAQAASKGQLSRAVFVRQRIDGPRYDQFNNHWLKVTGIVDAEQHGPLGGSYACEIFLERIQPLPRPPLQDSTIYALFRNETRNPVTVEASWQGGYAKFNLGPGGINSVAIREGRVVVTTSSGKPVAKGNLVSLRSGQRYFDSDRRTFYYRITDGRVELVPLSEAKGWKS